MRGLQTHVTDHLSHDRIIPARAGFTLSSTRRLPVRADHPRACGVYQVEGRLVHSPSGSSPRVRGLPAPWFPAGPCRGIIPARAGFTAWPYAQGYARQDHPRACGVYGGLGLSHHLRSGSSPRVRGLLCRVTGVTRPGRIIPARAGFTIRPGVTLRVTPDHPRACGVYS